MTVIMSAIFLFIGATSSRVVSGTEICTGAPAGEGGRLAFRCAGIRTSQPGMTSAIIRSMDGAGSS
jgi:hypothetical protein